MLDPGASAPIMSGCSFQEAVSADETLKFSRGITRSYRIRSYPNGAQRRLRDRWFGAYRWL
jgi:Helix-turn-helix domain